MRDGAAQGVVRHRALVSCAMGWGSSSGSSEGEIISGGERFIGLFLG